MCGLSGYLTQFGNKITKGHLDAMASTLTHRDPDATGYYTDSVAGLAHNRLSLIDLSSNGDQPFEDDRYVLVYNGEIYNLLELRSRLPAQPYRSSSDTEVLFVALREWGIEETLRQARGMFAFAWYDKVNHTVTLARDRIGIKPLFYGTDHQGTVWFASEIKALLAAGRFEVNPIRALFSAFGILEKSRYETAWHSIFQVKPGSYVRISASGLSEHVYFQLTDMVKSQEYQRLDRLPRSEVVAEFDHLFSQAIERMLISDAPMGAYVSGGIDSSLIATYAVRHQKALKLFTANILGKYSEFADARELASHLQQPLFDYPFERNMALRDWARVTWHYESPLVVHFNAIPFSNVSALARQEKVKAVLTGEGSDELFLGYPSLLTRRYDGLLKSPFDLLQRLYSGVPGLRAYIRKDEGALGLLSVLEQATQNFSRQMLRAEGIQAYDFLPAHRQQEQYLTAQMMQEGINSLLWRNDRMGMIHSVEARFPFLDEDIIAFAMNLPVRFKISRTLRFHNVKHPFLTDKWIVRKLAEGKLPASLVNKKKNGFPTYGLRHVSVRPEFFSGGVLAEWLGLSASQTHYLCDHYSRYHVALLASVEIWGQLFAAGNSTAQTSDRINQYIQIV